MITKIAPMRFPGKHLTLMLCFGAIVFVPLALDQANAQVQLQDNGSIFQYTGTACSGDSCPGWRRLDSNPRTVAVTDGSGSLLQLQDNGSIFRYTGTPCSGDSCPGWVQLDSNPRTKAIASGAPTAFLPQGGWAPASINFRITARSFNTLGRPVAVIAAPDGRDWTITRVPG
jgi:hypothetical protein